MTARSMMVYRARVERGISSGLDDFGHPLPPDWGILFLEMPCMVMRNSTTELNGDVTVVKDELSIDFPRAFAVTERDRIAAVTDRLGAVYQTGPLNILSVAEHANFKHALLGIVGQ